MNKTLKKVSAAALAFAMLSTGTIAANTISPESSNSIVASASSAYYSKYCPGYSQWLTSQSSTSVKIYAEYRYGSFTGWYTRYEYNISTRRYEFKQNFYDTTIQPF